MIKKLKYKKSILLISIIIISGYFLISLSIGNSSFYNLKSLINYQQKELIKKYIFPYNKISEQEQMISQQNEKIESIDWSVIELQKKNSI